ncbi:bcl-2-like protein 12 [Spea bombifrons]|uniref:bcl-2-like protein 12 n=1 Tax=Spea bombifrons TaxID=233779 RepID=UPI00234AA99B|nr:bcl-2-like protein 12 [Spea bombifrons]
MQQGRGMDATVNSLADDVSLIKVKEETKLVLEAFLKRSLIHDGHIGHVGRAYHDPKRFCQGPHVDEREESTKRKKKPEKKKRSKEPEQEKDELTSKEKEGSTLENNGTWNSLHEKINHAEEKKHGFQTSIKKLLRRHSHSKEKSSVRWKGGSVHSKSRESLENVLDEPKKGSTKGDSLKRQKIPLPILACAAAGSVDSLAHKEKEEVEAPEKHSSQSKLRTFTFKNILKKKSKGQSSNSESPPVRPAFLPVTPCYKEDAPHDTDKANDSQIYNLAAKKLDNLVQQKILRSPTGLAQSPVFPASRKGVPPLVSDNNNVVTSETTTPEDKDELIRKLVVLLQEQAVVINEKINKDPFLRNALSRMSYGSFSRLAEVFTSQAGVAAGGDGASVSPELTKIALTMELTRKVAGINSHAVHTLMGYSLQYMDMFVPWLQKQGGWENIVVQGDILDVQID